MFNGSENAPGEYFEYTRAMGATDLNGTTWFDRTNYFQTVPRPQSRAGPVPRKRPDGPSARRAHPGESDQPDRRRPEREAPGRQRALRPGRICPARRRCSPKAIPIATRRSARWPTCRAATLDTVARLVPRELRAEQRRPRPRRRHRRRRGAAAGRALFRRRSRAGPVNEPAAGRRADAAGARRPGDARPRRQHPPLSQLGRPRPHP